MVLSNKEWLDKMDEIISAIQNGGGNIQVIEDMLSNMWSSSVTYNVGDYVLYNNNIWKCLVQNSNIAPTEGSTWTSVKITNEISTLNSNLNYSSNSTISVINMEGYNSRDNFCFRDGNIVTVSCEVWGMSVTATGVYFNIPEGYRPKHPVRIMGYVEYSGKIEPSMLTIATDGNVFVSHGSGLTSQIAFACTYSI